MRPKTTRSSFVSGVSSDSFLKELQDKDNQIIVSSFPPLIKTIRVGFRATDDISEGGTTVFAEEGRIKR